MGGVTAYWENLIYGQKADLTTEAINSTGQAIHTFASVKEWELITATDHDITINNGVAMAIYSESPGSQLQITNSKSTNKQTPVFPAVFTPWKITSIHATGTSLVGNVYAVAW